MPHDAGGLRAPADALRVRPWDDPEVVGWRREPTSTLRRATQPGGLDLDGTWRFQLLASPDHVPTASWGEAQVPGCWTAEPAEPGQPADAPRYTNDQMPWPDLPPLPPRENPTGVYEREVEVPAAWRGQRVLLHVGAAESVLLVEVDGLSAGASTDSHLAAEFDITDLAPPGRTVTVRLVVVKWSAQTYAEDQDQWWHGGVTRSVRLFTRPRLHLSDVRVETSAEVAPGDLADDPAPGSIAVDVRVGSDDGRLPDGWSVTASLATGPGEDSPRVDLHVDEAAHADAVAHERVSVYRGRVRLLAELDAVLPWSAERPHLHQLVVHLLDADGVVVDSSTQRVGFRTVRIEGPDLLVNGRRVHLRGVNRHDRSPVTGRVVTADEARAELLAMKRWGFNALRTAHYPDDPTVLDLADELGLYVVDETDLETHAYAHELCDDPAYLGTFLARLTRMVRRDRNHPSVITWSLGNESDYGANHDAMAAWVRRDDPTRPVQYEGAIKDDWSAGHAASDVVCPMYASVEDLLAHVRDGVVDRPVVLCEYSHAMGNSGGGLDDYWRAIESHRGLQGGFVWEWADHGILQRADGQPAGRAGAGQWHEGRAADGYRWARGGDFGEDRHDGSFCWDGVVFPEGTPKPALAEHRELASPVRLTLDDDGGVRLYNAQDALDLGWLTGTWRLDGADGARREAPAALPHLLPGRSAVVELPAELAGRDPAVEHGLVLELRTARDLPWCPAGTLVALPAADLPASAPATAPVRAAVTAGTGLRVADDGSLAGPHLLSGPRLALWRAPTDNDRAVVADRWAGQGLASLAPEDLDVQRRDGSVVVVSRLSTALGEVRHEQRSSAGPVPGSLRFDELVLLPEGLDDVPRVGVVLEVGAALARASWFGRGPWETYPDRCTAPLGLHEADVASLTTPYLRPQENGGRAQVRWWQLEAPGAVGGLRVWSDRPLQVSAGPHSAAELDACDHEADLPPTDRTVLHVDAAHRGLGSASCGPDTAVRHRMPGGEHRWTWWLQVWEGDPSRRQPLHR